MDVCSIILQSWLPCEVHVWFLSRNCGNSGVFQLSHQCSAPTMWNMCCLSAISETWMDWEMNHIFPLISSDELFLGHYVDVFFIGFIFANFFPLLESSYTQHLIPHIHKKNCFPEIKWEKLMKTLKGCVISYSYRIYQKLTSLVLVPAHSISCQPWGVRGQFQRPQGMRPGRFNKMIQIILNTAWWVILMEFHERLKVNLIGVFFSKFMSITWNKLQFTYIASPSQPQWGLFSWNQWEKH